MITIIASSVVIILGLQSMRLSLYAFVFFLPFIPRSLGISFGSGDGALTFARITIPLMIATSILKSLATKNFKFKKLSTSITLSIAFLAVLGLVKLLSAMHNGTSIIHVIDDIIRTIGVMLIFLFLGSKINLKNLTILVWLSFLFSALISVLEYYLGHPIHAPIVNARLLEGVLESQVRGGVYRVQSLFDGPLFFAEFIVYSLCVFLFLRPSLPFPAILVSVVLFLFLFWANGSRSLIAVSAVIIFLSIFLPVWRSSNQAVRFTLTVGSIVIILFLSNFIVTQIQQLGGANFIGGYNELDPLTRSSTARAQQFYEVWELTLDRPILGVGMMQNYVTEGVVHTLDNYFLRILLESGLFGLFLFVGFIVVSLRHLLQVSVKKRHLSEGQTALFLIYLLVGFASYRFFFQDPSGTALFFALFGAGLGKLSSEKLNSQFDPLNPVEAEPD